LLTFHPLILRFLADLDNSKFLAQHQELNLPQWFCQNVSDVFFSANMLNLQLPIPNTLPDEMKTHINILCFGRERLGFLLTLQLGEKMRQPDSLTRRRGFGDVLRFAGREGDHLLLLGLLGDREGAIEEQDSRRAFPGVSMSPPMSASL
jgi:hypothetical protein